jgi:ferritin-like metal-binding protein YciE
MISDKPQILDTDALKQVFIHNLNRIYFAKCYLDGHLEHLIDIASFPALKLAIGEFGDDIKRQIKRLHEVYALMDETPSDKNCNPIKSIIKDNFCLDDKQALPLFTDMDIMAFMQLLEHINISACSMMKIIAAKLNNGEVEQLLRECFDESIDNDHLFTLISKEYISAD